MLPFYDWNWLNALEESESVSSRYGWQPLHLSLWENNRLISLAPLYLKNHSYGEFIFDQAFANLSNRLSVPYYPKLIGMSPLSPIEGYKFFISSEKDSREITEVMMKIIDEFAINNNISSCNFLYVDPSWKKHGESANCSSWINKQTLWSSHGEQSFEDYLARFNSNQRRNIKKERQSITKTDLRISIINGEEINLAMMEMMHNFYEAHCSRWGAWGSKYLTKAFFERLANKDLANNIVLFNANRGNPKEPIAMSFCITDYQTLWGRYWGSKEEIKNLHFELCYYSPISWAIKNGIKEFDPGAGGNQKMRRGFTATPRFSLHRWYDNTMAQIIKDWLPKANNMMKEEINASNNEVPFIHTKIDL
ncbi:hypothetical protein EV09_1499 [Prochlorococcus marinus str. SS35]|nr:hypothetical protein EV09_1499 [Prochlorococcus marinus str. SS35]